MAFIRQALMLLVLALLVNFSLSCNSGGSSNGGKPEVSPARRSTVTARTIGSTDTVSEEGEDEEDYDTDETVEDIELSEDFDLICDGHVTPDRIKRTPDTIIFGARKGGTRALIEFLKLNPKVKATNIEVHYFDKHYEKGLDWYVSNMREVVPGAGEIAVEKTPGYFHTSYVPARVAEMDPNIKLLLILRNPVKRMISDYNQFRARHMDEGKTYPSLEEKLFTSEGQINTNYKVLQRSIYHKHMRPWLLHFPREQIHIVDGEKFIRTPWTELQKVETFLNLTSVLTQDNFFFNGTKGFYCSRDIRSHGSWTCTRDKCLGRSKGRPKPPVKEETFQRLTEFFAPHNKMFYDMVGQVFEWPAYD